MIRPSISIVIPTQRRPHGLEVAARSAFHQAGVDRAAVELVIVDNDQVPSAAALVATLAAEAPFPVLYVHEPNAGVANARNAALAKASGDFIAFLDDDEEAPPSWLSGLLAVQARYDADAVFGPVKARAPASVREHRGYLERFFSRVGPETEGLIDHHYGCGDSLIRRAALPDPERPFSAVRNFIGGEDDLLFAQMREAGARFAWAPAAWVWEDPVPSRLTLGYTIRRAFAYGQGPTSACAIACPPDRVGIAKWMVVGVAQTIAFGLVAAAKWVMRTPDRAEALDRAARGLGKTFWWGPFKIHFYGQTAPTLAGANA